MLGICTLHPTHTNWKPLSDSICAGLRSPMDKYYAIYRWLCDNIAYDTTYTIYDADQCLRAKKGVCMAYSEIFHHLAAAQGLKAEVICGNTKDETRISEYGHAWIFAYTDPSQRSGMLIDPTWGAGSVSDDGVFERKGKDDSWFNAHPAWMIFTHFPDNRLFQMLKPPLTLADFAGLPKFSPFMARYGFDATSTLRECLRGREPQLPRCYNVEEIRRARLPQQRQLLVGKTYEVAVVTPLPIDRLGFLGSAVTFGDATWHKQGAVAIGKVLIERPGDLHVAIKLDPSKPSYSSFAEYEAVR